MILFTLCLTVAFISAQAVHGNGSSCQVFSEEDELVFGATSYLQLQASRVGDNVSAMSKLGAGSLQHVHAHERAYESENPNSLGDQSPKVAICITGQLSRLELNSKVQNLLIPLSKTSALLHVFTSLESGEEHYVSNLVDSDSAPTITSSEMITLLKPFYQIGSIHPHVNYTANISRWNEKYLDQSRANSHPCNRSQRLASHFSQWSTVKQCVDLIQRREAQLGVSYDVVIKIRDSTLVTHPFRLFSPRDTDKNASTDSVIVKNCANWYGIEDKTMVLPRAHLSVALGGMISILQGVEHGNPDVISRYASIEDLKTPEQLLKTLLEVNSVPFVRVNATMLPFVDSRYKSKVGWCPVDSWKDCMPDGPQSTIIPKGCESMDDHLDG